MKTHRILAIDLFVCFQLICGTLYLHSKTRCLKNNQIITENVKGFYERVVFDKRIEWYYESVLLGHDIENTDVFDALKMKNIFPKKHGNENIIRQKP